MKKSSVIGSILLIIGIIVEFAWRFQSKRYFNYDNAGPGFYLAVPGLVILLSSLSRRKVEKKDSWVMERLKNVMIAIFICIVAALISYIAVLWFMKNR